MAYQVKLTVFANNIAKKFSPEIKKAAKKALNELAKNPYLGKELQADLSGFWSYRFLRYRIIFRFETEAKSVTVWAIGHRRDIYQTMSEHHLRFLAEK